jgi:hypothetical protein
VKRRFPALLTKCVSESERENFNEARHLFEFVSLLVTHRQIEFRFVLFFLDFAIRSFLHFVLHSRSRRLKAISSECLRVCSSYSGYLGAVPKGCFAACWIESVSVMIVPLLNGGPAFAGKSGRNTANACETNAIQTNMIAAAHFMSRGLIKLRKRDKKNFRIAVVIPTR